MSYKEIYDSVDKTIDKVCEDFISDPTLFYTEDDIVCHFYYNLRQHLKNCAAEDKDKKKHLIIHKEYPTPFRCDMNGNNFKVVCDDERSKSGGKYKRGHYDIVVLNPDFIKEYSYNIIKAQNYELYKNEVISKLDNSSFGPVILYGLEFMYSRDPLQMSTGQGNKGGIDDFAAKIIQDADKLKVSRQINNFMVETKMLVFIKDSTSGVKNALISKLSGRKDVVLCFDN